MGGKKKSLLLIAGIIIIAALLIVSARYLLSSRSSYIVLDGNRIECYENALYFIQNDANISSDALNVQSVRCLQKQSYEEWEMTGTYFENDDHSGQPKPFYFQEIRGGMAASGADTYYEVCLIIDNQEVISKIETGRNLDYQSQAKCVWQTRLP
jgi:hypothetical protein